MDRVLLVGMAHEFPAVVFRLLRNTGVVLANARTDGARRLNLLSLEQIKESPHADAHSVFVPAPVGHVGKMCDAAWRRQHLPRHRLADAPDLKIDDGPEYQARPAGKPER